MPAAPGCRLEIGLFYVHDDLGAGLGAELADDIGHEAAAVWRANGVELTWRAGPAQTGALTWRTDLDVYLQTTAPPDRARARVELATVWFTAGMPSGPVRVLVSRIMRLVRTVRFLNRSFDELPARLRRSLAARAIGRAVAHEIGHVLLASRVHSNAGLMRERFGPDDFVEPMDDRFLLSTAEMRQLTSGSTCGDPLRAAHQTVGTAQ